MKFCFSYWEPCALIWYFIDHYNTFSDQFRSRLISQFIKSFSSVLQKLLKFLMVPLVQNILCHCLLFHLFFFSLILNESVLELSEVKSTVAPLSSCSWFISTIFPKNFRWFSILITIFYLIIHWHYYISMMSIIYYLLSSAYYLLCICR